MARNSKYQPDWSGLRALGRESFVTGVALDAARSVQAFAQRDDHDGDYAVGPTTVTAGRNNETRNGAVVVEVHRAAGARRRSLVRAAQEARSR